MRRQYSTGPAAARAGRRSAVAGDSHLARAEIRHGEEAWPRSRGRENLPGVISSPRNPQIDAIINSWLRENSSIREDGPGCAVAVMRDSAIVHVGGYGMADLEHRVKITPAAVFHVASLSKQFTAFAVLDLADRGKLDLDDDVRVYVPQVPVFGPRITLRHLLHHMSGLRDQWKLLRLAGWRWMDEFKKGDVLDVVRRQRDLNFSPGEGFSYCNTGYTLLGAVVERVAGAPLREFARARIFKPLGMRATHFRHDHMKLIKQRAFGYRGEGKGPFQFWVPNFDLVGPTGLYTTVEDLLRWARHLMKPRAKYARVVAALTRRGSLKGGTRVGYGAGVGIGSYRGLPVVSHSGWDLGYASHLAIYPTARFAVVILGNLSSLTPALPARRIADECLGKRFPRPPVKARKVPVAELEREAGLYRHAQSGTAVWVKRAGAGLGMGQTVLGPLGGRRFVGPEPDETTEVKFTNTIMSVRDEFGVTQRFERVFPVPRRVKLAEYEGTYHSSELGVALTFAKSGKALRVRRPKWPATTALPAYKDAFTDDTTTYAFVRAAGGRVVAVEVSQDRLYRLRFDRR
jgi:CubicO group peptidase (beta-lactamase class C family)